MGINLRTLSLSIAFAVPNFATAKKNSCDPHLAELKPTAKYEALAKRYSIDAEKIKETKNDKIPVVLRKTTKETLAPPTQASPILELEEYDAVIVGGGPSGLTAAVYLTKAGKKVLVVEREEELGGLASGRTMLNKISVGTGTAYAAGPAEGKQMDIFKDIGLGDYKKRFSIYDSIDSYTINGEVFEDIWEEHSLAKLPASFELFKLVLLELANSNYSDSNLLKDIRMNRMFADDFIRLFPEIASRSKSPEVQTVYKRFLNDSRVDRKDPMRVVLELLDLYGRSALGGESHEVPSVRYCYFYVSELRKRFTNDNGTGFVADALLKTLSKAGGHFNYQVNAPVAEIDNTGDKVHVTYIRDGQAFKVRAKKVIFAAPLPLAPKLIKNFRQQDPEKAEAIAKIKMTDYSVHVVHVLGHPFRMTYDLWARLKNYRKDHPTDIINGRWMDPLIKGYEGMRDFKKHPADDFGVLTLFHPHSGEQDYSEENSLRLVEQAVRWMHEILDPIVAKDNQKIEVQLVETYRHVHAIHQADLDHDDNRELFERALKNIEFSNNNIAVPELETAMELGYDAAMRILAEPQSVERHHDQTQEPR